MDTLRAWRTPQQHYGMAALVLNVVIATRTHGHGHVSTHVRWLYSLIRVANTTAVFLFGVPSTRAVLQIVEGLPGLVVCWLLALGDLVLSQRGTREHSQAGVLIILLHRKRGSELQGFFWPVSRKNCPGSKAQADSAHCAASIGKLGQSSHTLPRWSRAGADIQSQACSGIERRWAHGAKPCVGHLGSMRLAGRDRDEGPA